MVICGETGCYMQKLKQTCSTRVFGLLYSVYGMGVGGGVSEIHLPVFYPFSPKFLQRYRAIYRPCTCCIVYIGCIMRGDGCLDCSLELRIGRTSRWLVGSKKTTGGHFPRSRIQTGSSIPTGFFYVATVIFAQARLSRST